MPVDHSESVLSKKHEIDFKRQEKNLQEAIQESKKHSKVDFDKKEFLEQRSRKSHDSNFEEFKSGDRKNLESSKQQKQNLNLKTKLSEKTKLAQIKRKEILDQKSEIAHLSSQDVTSARVRKELYDAIDESEKHLVKHEAILKAELVEANRVDHLNAVREKQHHLQ